MDPSVFHQLISAGEPNDVFLSCKIRRLRLKSSKRVLLWQLIKREKAFHVPLHTSSPAASSPFSPPFLPIFSSFPPHFLLPSLERETRQEVGAAARNRHEKQPAWIKSDSQQLIKAQQASTPPPARCRPRPPPGAGHAPVCKQWRSRDWLSTGNKGR